LQPPKIFSVSRLPPILLPFLALIIATPAPAAPAENAGDRILTTPARETTVARESRLRTTLAALAPADFSAAAEATRTEFARLLVLDVERDFAEAISLLEPLLARATAAPADLNTIESLQSTLGLACAYTGRDAEARTLLDTACATATARLGPDHPATLNLRGNRASFLVRLGETATPPRPNSAPSPRSATGATPIPTPPFTLAPNG
jgi:hypothetical protein